MPNINNFSSIEIHILENGLRWIKEAHDRFGNKFYHRLMQEHPRLNPFLQSMGPLAFTNGCVQFLNSTMREIGSFGKVLSPLKVFWPQISNTGSPSLEPSEWIKIAETFLDLVSELAEDAWSPALEYAWRKAVKAVMAGLCKPVKDSSVSSTRFNPQAFLFKIGKKQTMPQPMRLYLGPLMFLAGGIAAFGLWMHCHLVETRSKARNPLHFSVCS